MTRNSQSKPSNRKEIQETNSVAEYLFKFWRCRREIGRKPSNVLPIKIPRIKPTLEWYPVKLWRSRSWFTPPNSKRLRDGYGSPTVVSNTTPGAGRSPHQSKPYCWQGVFPANHHGLPVDPPLSVAELQSWKTTISQPESRMLKRWVWRWQADTGSGLVLHPTSRMIEFRSKIGLETESLRFQLSHIGEIVEDSTRELWQSHMTMSVGYAMLPQRRFNGVPRVRKPCPSTAGGVRADPRHMLFRNQITQYLFCKIILFYLFIFIIL